MSQPDDDSPRQEVPDETPEATPAAAFLARVGNWVQAVAGDLHVDLRIGGAYTSYWTRYGSEDIRGVVRT